MKFRNYAVGAADVELEQILKPIIAIESTPALSKLDQPRPNLGSRSLHRNSPGRYKLRVRYDLIPR